RDHVGEGLDLDALTARLRLEPLAGKPVLIDGRRSRTDGDGKRSTGERARAGVAAGEGERISRLADVTRRRARRAERRKPAIELLSVAIGPFARTWNGERGLRVLNQLRNAPVLQLEAPRDGEIPAGLVGLRVPAHEEQDVDAERIEVIDRGHALPTD